MLIIGLDPDAKKYGLAIYQNKKLTELKTMDTVEFVEYLAVLNKQKSSPTFVIEDVSANKFMYARGAMSPAMMGKIAQNVGACKHSQQVAEQFIQHFKFALVRQPPTGGNWAKNAPLFKAVTGWTKLSSEDTRSAAFMAFLHLNRIDQLARKL